VISCYDYHLLNGVDVARDLHRITYRGGGRYKPLLEHIARRKGRRQAVIRVRHRRRAAPPILTPQQIERPASLTGLSARDWERQMARATQRPARRAAGARHGQRPSPAVAALLSAAVGGL